MNKNKIVLVSDNHLRDLVLDEILLLNDDAALFVHCGDSEMPYDAIPGYIKVCGNNDYDYAYPMEQVIEFNGHRIFVTHGHRYMYFNQREGLVKRAHELDCDIVFFGHTHVFEYRTIDGVTLINPGSLYRNRDGSKPSYAIVELDENSIKVKKVEI